MKLQQNNFIEIIYTNKAINENYIDNLEWKKASQIETIQEIKGKYLLIKAIPLFKDNLINIIIINNIINENSTKDFELSRE